MELFTEISRVSGLMNDMSGRGIVALSVDVNRHARSVCRLVERTGLNKDGGRRSGAKLNSVEQAERSTCESSPGHMSSVYGTSLV